MDAFAQASLAHALLTLPDASFQRASIVVEPKARLGEAANVGGSNAAQEAGVKVAVQMCMSRFADVARRQRAAFIRVLKSEARPREAANVGASEAAQEVGAPVAAQMHT